MKTFEKYLEKMGYSWNDFERNYEMENLIEQYADEKVKQLLLHNVSNRRELLIDCVRTCLQDEESVTVEQQVDTYLQNHAVFLEAV